MIISLGINIIMRNVSDKIVEKITHFVFGNFSENRCVYVIMWENMAESENPQII